MSDTGHEVPHAVEGFEASERRIMDCFTLRAPGALSCRSAAVMNRRRLTGIHHRLHSFRLSRKIGGRKIGGGFLPADSLSCPGVFQLAPKSHTQAQVALRRETQAAQEVLEARVGAQEVELGCALLIGVEVRSFVASLVQPMQRFIPILEEAVLEGDE